MWSLGEEAGQVAVAAVVADVVVVASIVVCVQVALAGKVVLVAMPASAGPVGKVAPAVVATWPLCALSWDRPAAWGGRASQKGAWPVSEVGTALSR